MRILTLKSGRTVVILRSGGLGIPGPGKLKELGCSSLFWKCRNMKKEAAPAEFLVIFLV